MPATRNAIIRKLVAVNERIVKPSNSLQTASAVRRAQDVIIEVPFKAPTIVVGIEALSILTGDSPTVETIHQLVGDRIGDEKAVADHIRSLCRDEILKRVGDKISIHPKMASAVSMVISRVKKK